MAEVGKKKITKLGCDKYLCSVTYWAPMGCNYGKTTVCMKNEKRFKTWGWSGGGARRGGGNGPKSKQMEYLASALRASVNNKNYTRASKSSFSFFKEESLFRVRWHTRSVGVGAAVSVVFPRHPRSPLLIGGPTPFPLLLFLCPLKKKPLLLNKLHNAAESVQHSFFLLFPPACTHTRTDR
jgi:hypothetical protein